ncbi:unnamed protein product [Mytilus coruscus]|uniref:Reverse transcriptase/retrotransposon-derived protein RNase H-like domain-containing protein n=1 Tax=Mytilus coruscus TaxID=42192 RepID=A0A6J8AQ76_MYTCO|nr:unnamed protein product [Mytilus coruscus]
MTKESKSIEEFRHAADLAEKVIDSNVNSVNSMNQTVLDEIHSLKEHIQSINVESTIPVTTQHQSNQPFQHPVYVQQPVYHTPKAPYHTMYPSNRHTKFNKVKNNCSNRENSKTQTKQFVTDMHQCLIPVNFGGINIKALLDTASTISAINEKIFLKTKAVETFPIPNNQHDVRSFLGLCNYYRKFVKGYAKIASPLNRLLTKDTPFKWTTDCQNTFDTLKNALTSTPVLNFPNFNKPFIVSCDASGSAIGYILSQVGDDEKEHVIGYGSRALTPAVKKLHGYRTRNVSNSINSRVFSRVSFY